LIIGGGGARAAEKAAAAALAAITAYYANQALEESRTTSSRADDGSTKFTTDIGDIFNGFKNWFTKGDKSNEFPSDIRDVFDGNLGISDNVEKFPRADDFLKGDTFTFPDTGNIKVKDYIETFPKGVDHWLESPFFESSDDSLEGLTPSEQRSVSSLRKRIEEHQAKLEEYRTNPDAVDNQGFLRNAPTEEIRQRIIRGRIRHLEKEIETFQKNINDITGE
jgi:hypothetical protein